MNNNIDIIEIGCGAGFAATYLEGPYRNYTGIDYSEKLINNAKYFNNKTLTLEVVQTMGAGHYIKNAKNFLIFIYR